jgi:O-acetyl-ADP-ribose deacetylase (regulator of RNase III)
LIAFANQPCRIEITDGDIAAQDADAIVNAANSHFWMGSGVAGALRARGGPEIEAEAVALGPVEPGECVVTSAGRLSARYVIHAAVMGLNLRTSADAIERASRNALTQAEALGCTSIAFPALGTGVGGFPLDRCARIMIGAVRAHHARSLTLVRFVLFGASAYQAFASAAGELLGAPLEGPPDCPISG